MARRSAAELGLLACVVATAFGLGRIFDTHDFMVPITVVAVLASLIAALLRRRGMGVLLSALIHSGAGVLVISNLFIHGHTRLGIPTLSTLAEARDLVRGSVAPLRTSVPPIETSTGLLILIAIAIWLLTFFADTAAFRAHARVQAILPLATAFLALGIPDSAAPKWPSAAVFGLGLGIYAITSLYIRDLSLRWIGDASDAARGASRLSASAAAVLVAALTVATLTPIVLPTQSALVNLRHRSGTGERQVPTPFVDVRSLLGPRSNAVMFTVKAETASYWRLTALDRYDTERDIWVSSGSYRKIGRTLPRSTARSVDALRRKQRYEVHGLGGSWIPAGFEPVEYSGDPVATFNEDTSTIFAEKELVPGQSYDVVSEAPIYSPTALARWRPRPATQPDFDPALVETPPASDAERAVIEQVVYTRPSPYEGLLELQNWFRSQFDYDERADFSESENPVSDFLTERTGFCQQFSSAFALIARRVGMPSRVAVGFTMGEELHDAPDDDGLRQFEIKGLHAHAWPEVLFPGLGWVAFEPTPGRGNPATTTFTGVTGAQASTGQGQSSTTTTATTTSQADQQGSTTLAPTTSTVPGQRPLDRSGEAPVPGRFPVAVAVLLGAVLAGSISGLVLVIRRRRSATTGGPNFPSDPDSRQLASAWNSALSDLGRLGLIPMDHETPLEFVARLGREADRIGPADVFGDDRAVLAAQMERLASIETLRRYSAEFETPENRDEVAVAGLIAESLDCARSITDATDRLVEGIPGIASAMIIDVPH